MKMYACCCTNIFSFKTDMQEIISRITNKPKKKGRTHERNFLYLHVYMLTLGIL